MVSCPGSMSCLLTALGDETSRQLGAFSVGHHPARHVAREDVQDDVQVVVGPFDRATQLGDIPRPNLVGRFGQKFRLEVVRMPQLVPALANLSVVR